MATQNNLPLLNRKEWQMMTPCPAASAAGSFFVAGTLGFNNVGMFVVNATTQYLYHHDEDAWVQIASGALAGTFGAGACGVMARWANTVTANGGSTTSVTTTANLNGLANGKTIRFLTGANAGQERTIDRVFTAPGGNATLGWTSPLGSAVSNGDTFTVNTGCVFVMSAGITASGSFKNYDLLTGTWTTLSNTGLPASWGTDGKMVNANSRAAFASGTATAGGASTLTNGAKSWTTNQWTNYQIRITSGTGIGQIRTVASNTGTVITVSSAWTTTPDATSQYNIEGNDDYFYLLGSGAVTMYRYSRSANTWTTMAPTTARGGAPSTGMSANWVDQTGITDWATESAILDGRYIYSFRGGAASTLDRFDIAGGTAGAGAWAAITYNNAAETFTTGSGYAADTRYIYIRKDATHRYFKYGLKGNYLEPVSTNLYADSTALLGDKVWVKNYDDAGVIKWLYSIRNTGTELFRIPLY